MCEHQRLSGIESGSHADSLQRKGEGIGPRSKWKTDLQFNLCTCGVCHASRASELARSLSGLPERYIFALVRHPSPFESVRKSWPVNRAFQLAWVAGDRRELPTVVALELLVAACDPPFLLG